MSQSSTPAPMTGPGWKVTNVVDGSGQDSTGAYVRGRNVTYQLTSGPAHTVFIPESLFGTDAASAAISADAATTYAVSKLTG